MKQPLIYALIDPRNGRIRYVGGTTQTLVKRLKQHIYAAQDIRNAYMASAKWIKSLLHKGIIPQIQLLCVCKGTTFCEEEIQWIAFCRWCGCNLSNTKDGGQKGTRNSSIYPHVIASISLSEALSFCCACCAYTSSNVIGTHFLALQHQQGKGQPLIHTNSAEISLLCIAVLSSVFPFVFFSVFSFFFQNPTQASAFHLQYLE